MLVNSALGNALSGIQHGMQRLERSADEIAKTSIHNEGDLTKPLLELQVNKLHTQANIRVLEGLDETLGSLLDVLA